MSNDMTTRVLHRDMPRRAEESRDRFGDLIWDFRKALLLHMRTMFERTEMVVHEFHPSRRLDHRCVLG